MTTCPHCHATVLSTSQPDEALGYATRLLEHFIAEHFPHNPDWKPLPDLIGVLTQLDNAITIARDYKDRLSALAATPAVGGEALDILERLSGWCAIERGKLGAIDGYDYRSGEEFGLRRAEIEIEKQFRAAAAPPASPLRGREPVAWRWRTLPKFSEDAADQEWELTPTAPNFINPHHHEVEPLFASPPEQPAADPKETT